MPDNAYPKPDALLVTAPACPHCPALKRALQQVVDEGLIASLTMLDVSQEPEKVRELGVKSVPWLRLGDWVLEGQMSVESLREWSRLAGTDTGVQRYFFHMLKNGQRNKVEARLRDHPQEASQLVALMRDPQASMAVRLGVGAVLEELAGTAAVSPMVPGLAAILKETDPRNRADAAHFLSLVGNEEAREVLRSYLGDEDPDVREIAQEALKEQS